jgi:hypothetical protein
MEANMSSFTDDLDVVDATAVEAAGLLYPLAQWLNGDPKLAAAPREALRASPQPSAARPAAWRTRVAWCCL